MKIFFHLLRHEIVDRKFWFLAAALAGFSIGSALYFADPAAKESVRDPLLLIAGTLTTGLTSFALGYQRTEVGILRGRLFEIARPLTFRQLALSKLLAGTLIGPACILLVLLPSLTSTTSPLLGQAPARSDAVEHFESQVYERLLPEGAALGTRNFLGPTFAYSVLSVVALGFLFFGALPICLWQTVSLTIGARSWLSIIDMATWVVFLWIASDSYYSSAESDTCLPRPVWLLAMVLSIIAISQISHWGSWKAGLLIRDVHAAHALRMNTGLLMIGTLFLLAARSLGQPDAADLDRYSKAIPIDGGSHWFLAGRKGNSPELFFLTDARTGFSRFLGSEYQILSLPKITHDGGAILMHTPFAENPRAGLFQTFHSGGKTSMKVQLPYLDSSGRHWDLDSDSHLVVININTDPELLVTSYSDLETEQRIALLPGNVANASTPTFMKVRHLEDHLFEVLLGFQEQTGTVAVQKSYFDALRGQLEDRRSWSLAGNTPPALIPSLLPLLERGLPVPDVSKARRMVVTESGSTAVLDRDYRLFFYNEAADRGRQSRDLPLRAVLAGEIKPGLLLVGVPLLKDTPPKYQSRLDWILGGIDDWQTWVIDSRSGEILRKMQGFVPMSHSEAGSRVWLIDKNGEPFDLDSAHAEPRPILPFRPRLAQQ